MSITSSSIAWACVPLVCGGAVVADAVRTADPVTSVVQTHLGAVRFELADHGAASCQGIPIDGTMDARQVCTLFKRVIVRTSDDVVLGGNAFGDVRPLGPAGFWVVETPTVGEAVALAEALQNQPGVIEAYMDIETPVGVRSTTPTDPNFSDQWHLVNTLEESDPAFDCNVEPAWCAGYTGAGVVVGVVDSGWLSSHPDLEANYNAEASQESESWANHGVSVAGIIASMANNGLGGVGVAYDAQISRLYFAGGATNVVAAFGHRNDINDIKNNSWGPSDNGTLHTMTSAERAALEEAIATGRDGRGEIFVWAGGNGRTANDRVDYDQYASSRYTLAVGSIDTTDGVSVYSEPGASLHCVSQSDTDIRSSADFGIYTTNGASGYTFNFGGTSAASPLAAGIVALMLDANPCLTWRDVQHVIINTTRKNDADNEGWHVNGAGRDVHDDYGFGAIDAGAAVLAAESWVNVAPEQSSTVSSTVLTPIPDGDETGVTQQIAINDSFLVEAVEVELNVTHTAVGNLRVTLESPSGTSVDLSRSRNDGTDGFANYLLTAVRFWDEPSEGNWTLTIADEVSGATGVWGDWELTVYGRDPVSPPICEFAGDVGVRMIDDLLQFLDFYFEGNMQADISCDGVVDIVDILAFLNCWL